MKLEDFLFLIEDEEARIELEIDESDEKEDYYYKALAEAQEKLYNMMVENSQEEFNN